jgi:hypothetical protein
MRVYTPHFSVITICMLGAAHPTESMAYPGGAAISYGQNPVWAMGGFVNDDATVEIKTAPIDQTLIVTDIHLTMSDDDTSWHCMAKWTIDLQTGDTNLGSFALQQYRHYSDGDSFTPGQTVSNITFSSGLPVPAGQTLNLVANKIATSGCTGEVRVHYVISGYTAQS